MRRLLLIVAIVCLGWPVDARVRWSTPGAYRLRVTGLTPFALDAGETDSGQSVFAEHRLRIRPTIEAGPLGVFLEIDVLTGQIFGDTLKVGTAFVERRHGDPTEWYDGWTTVEPRQAWFDLQLPWFDLQAGQMGADWGMGLLDDDGEDDDEGRWVARLGDKRNGDLVDRVMVSVRPLRPFTHGPLGDAVLSLGGDHVWQDDLASALSGDTAWRVVGSLWWPGDALAGGLYGVHRWQTDEDGDETSLTAISGHMKIDLPLFLLGAQVRFEGETVWIFGETNALRPATSPEGVELLSVGWVTRAETAWRCPRIAAALEVGYAAGDADPDDDEWRAFSFDPDFDVGLVLFPDVLRLISLRSAERAADPNRVGIAQAGADWLPTDGAVRNALYLNPGVTWRPGQWTLTGMAVLAWGSEPFVEPFETFEAGGKPRNHRGEPASRFYGVELAVGADWHFDLGDVAVGELGIEGAAFYPGPALDEGLDDGPVAKVVGRAGLAW